MGIWHTQTGLYPYKTGGFMQSSDKWLAFHLVCTVNPQDDWYWSHKERGLTDVYPPTNDTVPNNRSIWQSNLPRIRLNWPGKNVCSNRSDFERKKNRWEATTASDPGLAKTGINTLGLEWIYVLIWKVNCPFPWQQVGVLFICPIFIAVSWHDYTFPFWENFNMRSVRGFLDNLILPLLW